MDRFAMMFLILLCGCTQRPDVATPASSRLRETGVTTSIDDMVSIEFSELSYRFPAAIAAQGIEINYEIVVRENVANVLPLSQHSQSDIQIDLQGHADEQKCVLDPFARLSGNQQFYGEFSGGCLAAPITISPAVLVHGRYSYTFEWSGRNLSNDGGGGELPYGAPFPPGEYVLNVSCIGKVVAQGVPEDFIITNNVTLTITD